MALNWTGLRTPLLSCFPQTQMLREAALDSGSGGGVQESPSSTPASRGTQPLGHLSLPPVPGVLLYPPPPPPAQHHSVTSSSLLVRNQPVV